MKVKKYLRDDKVKAGLEVTKEELFDLIHKYEFISVSKADLNWLDTVNDNEIVGVVFGNIEAFNNPKYINPDCWFVNKEYVDRNYKELENSYFTFGEAIALLKQGYKVAREGWNGKGMWLVFVPGREVEIAQGTPYWSAGLRGKIKIDGHIDMYTAKGTIQPGWLASQADILAEDWVIVKD